MSRKQKYIFKPMGAWLRELREDAGLSQRDVAKHLKVKSQFVSNIERGKSCYPPKMAKRFMQFVGQRPSEFGFYFSVRVRDWIEDEMGLWK